MHWHLPILIKEGVPRQQLQPSGLKLRLNVRLHNLPSSAYQLEILVVVLNKKNKMAKKAKARVILVKLLSTAGTGYNYIKSRPRINPKLSLMKYDPVGTFICNCFFSSPSKVITERLMVSGFVVKQHVLFNETKMKK